MDICVFGASSDRIDLCYFEAGFALGALMARAGHRLIFGGGKEGLMGACARGVLENGGEALGIAPRFFDEPGVLMKDACPMLFTDTMSERKKLMEDKADAFIALPGGIGTFEEFFEVLTLKQLGQHGKPMALLNTGAYYDPFCNLLHSAAEGRFMSERVLDLFAVCSTPEEALSHVTDSAPEAQSPFDLTLYSR